MAKTSAVETTVPCSAVDLASRFRTYDPLIHRASQLFGVTELACSALVMSERGRAETFASLQAPRHAIECQSVVALVDRVLHREALVNPLRARRAANVSGLTEPRQLAESCRWCDPASSFAADILREGFDVPPSASGRVVAGPNHARLAPLSGVVVGDDTMHDLLGLSTDDAAELFEAADAFITAAHRVHAVPFWMVVQNGGRRSAGSVEHAHLQVLGRPDRHFAEPARVAALGPPTYWQTVADIHHEIGLGIDLGRHGTAFATLVPVKERDFTVVTSGSLVEGARAIWPLVRALISSGTSSWSLAAMPNPRQYGIAVEPYRTWPNIVWRFVDRGSSGSFVADIGSMELFGSAVLATDPYVLAELIRQSSDLMSMP